MKKKLFSIVIIILILLLIVKYIFKIDNINVKGPFNAPTYIVNINETTLSSTIESKKKIISIPYFIDINVVDIHFDEGILIYEINKGEELKISIEGYNCFLDINDKKQLACSDNNSGKKLELIKNINYTLTVIDSDKKSFNQGDNIIYDGEYIEDLSEILISESKYIVIINAVYEKIVSKIILDINVV